MATFKHISSKNADYGAAEQYLTFAHDEFTMKPTLDGNRRLVLRDDYRISSLNETVINPPAELGRLTDAGGGEQSTKMKNSAV